MQQVLLGWHLLLHSLAFVLHLQEFLSHFPLQFQKKKPQPPILEMIVSAYQMEICHICFQFT